MFILLTPPLNTSGQPSLSKSATPTITSFVFPADSPPAAILLTVTDAAKLSGEVVIEAILLLIKLNFLLVKAVCPLVVTAIKSLELPFGTITDKVVVVAELTFA